MPFHLTAPVSMAIPPRFRTTPYSARVAAAGARTYALYNRTLLPTVFKSQVADYHHLRSHVQIWDVAAQRQIALCGPDAARLLRMVTPRHLPAPEDGRCYYVPVVDQAGGMLNDPVVLKRGADRFWLSIADSDLALWLKGLVAGLRLAVDVSESDVWPLAVQGPQAEALMARVFGDAVRAIRFFRFAELPFAGHPLVVARSGYSTQDGFEIYVEGWELGEPLWDALFAAGADLQVRAGCPNIIDRLEGGMLSYGNDMTAEHTPYDCGLDAICQPAQAVGCLGREALLRVARDGPQRRIRRLTIDGAALPGPSRRWPIRAGGREIGQVGSAAWSPAFDTMIALGMVAKSHWQDGTRVEVDTPAGPRGATVREHGFT